MDSLFTYILARICSWSRPTNSSMRKPKQSLDYHVDCNEERGSFLFKWKAVISVSLETSKVIIRELRI